MTDRVERRWTTRRLGVAIAGALAIVVIGVRLISGRGDAGFRGGNQIALIAPADAAVLTERRFSWRRFPTATSYELHILNTSGDSVYSIMTADTTLMLPTNAGLVSGEEYVWSVRAIVVGETRASSQVARFRLTGTRP
ncbi:MAG TPA: hypothetical protein VFT29_19265 [Gemmatimonadaceae bacterium]|nr:hypothetical protein [Gemmatimonadaceae bacterium]